MQDAASEPISVYPTKFFTLPFFTSRIALSNSDILEPNVTFFTTHPVRFAKSLRNRKSEIGSCKLTVCNATVSLAFHCYIERSQVFSLNSSVGVAI